MTEWIVTLAPQQPTFAESVAPVWSAVAASITALTAVIAVVVAVVQLRHARRIRQEQAQPYIAVFIESGNVSAHFVDLVVKNFGKTAARNVNIEIDPLPVRSGQAGDPPEAVEFPRSIPTLVPGQEWRTLWDFAPDRKTQDLPSQHKVTVTCDGVLGADKLKSEFELNWDTFMGRRWVQTYGVHDAAKALREMERQMRGWREGVNRGLKVFVRDGDRHDEEQRQRRADELAEAERIRSERRAVEQGRDSET